MVGCSVLTNSLPFPPPSDWYEPVHDKSGGMQKSAWVREQGSTGKGRDRERKEGKGETQREEERKEREKKCEAEKKRKNKSKGKRSRSIGCLMIPTIGFGEK